MDELEAVEAKLDNGELEAARKMCNELLLRRPVNANELVCLGRLFEKMLDVESAYDAYTRAMGLEPQNSSVITALGMLLYRQGKLSLASSYLRRAVVSDPRDPGKQTLLGVALIDQGFREEGIRHLGLALSFDPEYEEAHFNMGLAFRDAEPAKALMHFQKAISLDAHYCKAFRELGYTFTILKDLDQAEQMLQRAWACDSTDVWVPIYWGNAKWEAGDILGAQEKFELALKLAPGFSVPYWSLGALMENIGNVPEAAQMYEKALELDPEDEIAQEKLYALRNRNSELRPSS